MNDPITIAMDGSGRFVLPKQIRVALGLGAGQQFRVEVNDDRVELTPLPQQVRLVEREGVLVMVSDEEVGEMTVEDVSQAVERGRRQPMDVPDTSVVVAALSSWHTHHELAFPVVAASPPAIQHVLGGRCGAYSATQGARCCAGNRYHRRCVGPWRRETEPRCPPARGIVSSRS